jgi:YD repeat-containing protein
VIRVVSVANGIAQVDSNGDGSADSPSTLALLGIDDAERRHLAALYSAGESLWRAPIDHFTPWDCNWPYGPPLDAEPPQLSAPGEENDGDDPPSIKVTPPASAPNLDDPITKCGSVIECENRGLGETAPVSGTPWSLHYRSHRTEGRSAAYKIDINVTGSYVPRSVKSVELVVAVAGQVVQKSFAPTPNRHSTFEWDGLNAYKQRAEGGAHISIAVGYTYDLVYHTPASFERAFAQVSGIRRTEARGREQMTLWQDLTVSTIARSEASLHGAWTNKAAALGGWSFSAHHAYDPRFQVLYMGTGEQRSAEPVVSPFAGRMREYGFDGDGGAATRATLSEPEAVAAGPDGSVYIADSINFVVRKVDPKGRITTIAGTPGEYLDTGEPLGGSGSATSARLNYPWDLEVAGDGTVYIAEHASTRKITPSGIISTVAGTNQWSSLGEGDGGPATQAKISPQGMTLGPDGAVYFIDRYGLRQVRDGIITTIRRANDHLSGYLIAGQDVACADDGSLYFVAITPQSTRAMVRHRPDGALSIVAHDVDQAFGIVTGRDGGIYYSARSGGNVSRVGPDGTVAVVVGGGIAGSSSDNGHPTAAGLSTRWLGRIAFGPNGALYITDGANSIIRKYEASLPGGVLPDGTSIVSADGSEVYQFDGNGRHLATVGRNGEPRLQFSYDSAGRLKAVTDADGNATKIERNGDGVPLAIVAPGGQRTALTLNDDGFLRTVTNPANESQLFTYTERGLLLSYIDARGKEHTYDYDDGGSLIKDSSPSGGTMTLSQVTRNQAATTTFTTAEGRQEKISEEKLKNGTVQRTTVDARGLTTTSKNSTDGVTITSRPDGSTVLTRQEPDPRYGLHAPLLAEQTVTTPAGRRWSMTASRTAVLTDPTKPFTLETETEVSTVNGRQYMGVFDAATRKSTPAHRPAAYRRKRSTPSAALCARRLPGSRP